MPEIRVPKAPRNLVFGEDTPDTGFVTAGDSVYGRQIRVRGVPAF